MRISSFAFIAVLLVFSHVPHVSAQTSVPNTFTANLSLGSRGSQVLLLQQILNRDPDTRIASAGLGSPGNETNYFGSLTKAAVMRFQAKYKNEVLAPAGLSYGNGYVGLYTRAKLNALSASITSTGNANPPVVPPVVTPAVTSTPVVISAPVNYVVNESEKIDVYAGDKILANVHARILSAINFAITSGSAETITLPTITLSEVPSVAIGNMSPRFGVSGTRVSINGTGVSSSSVIYFGNNYIVRMVSKDIFGNFSFAIPPLPSARYDIAIKTGNNISNTTMFVITDPRNPAVQLKSISPTTIAYGGTLTITGSGFSPQNNVVVTTYQKFTGVPSPDGTTLTVQLTLETLREAARIGRGTDKVLMSVYVVNDYGFSDSEKSFTMTL